MTAPLKVLLVDDEPLARDNLRILLARDEETTVWGECGDGARALEWMRRGEVDLVFLDVQMPGPSGLDVLDALEGEALPEVIFTTAHDEYALAAFEHRALDFLLKPYSDERFDEVLVRAKERLREKQAARLAGQLAALAGDRPVGRPSSWITVKAEGRLVRLDTARIRWVEAADYRLQIHHDEGALTVRRTLDQLEATLDGQGFCRIHRSALVSLERIREVVRDRGGALALVLDDGTRLKVARARRAALERRLSSGA